MYLNRLNNADALFGDGGGKPAPRGDKPTAEELLASVAAGQVLNAQFLPALRLWMATAVASIRANKLAADAFARYVHFMTAAGRPAPDPHTFDAWGDAAADVCRAVVRAGLLDRTDSVFDGFMF